VRTLVDDLVRTVLTVAVVVFVLRWTWSTVRPLLPVVVFVVVVVVVVKLAAKYREYW
jgi:uncharacterized membrane protein YhhN